MLRLSLSKSLSRAMLRPAVQQRRTYIEWTNSMAYLNTWTDNKVLQDWVMERIRLFQPSRVHLCDGSPEEHQSLIDLQVRQGSLVPLNPKIRPGSYATFSSKEDVARVEERTFICSESEQDAGPTNHWRDPFETQEYMNNLFEGCMKGRTMYVVPFCMGPIGSDLSHIGVEITDSPYVVTGMNIMTRMGKPVLDQLGPDGFFVPCIHSVGAPLKAGQQDVAWPCNAKEKWIVHFPEQRRIWSYGSGYGGNALLGKKCFALRIASAMAREEGWLAEHMLIVGITNPEGEKKYIAAAFPSACGKTNLAMLLPTLPGWKVECVGDDIAWMRVNPKDGKLYAINPEAGFFGVAPGTSDETNYNAMRTLDKNTIFTNVGITRDFDVWWEGLGDKAPAGVTSWLRRDFDAQNSSDCAHPNSRFTAPASQCPVIDADWENPEGVPIDAIIFGGRRSTTMPLVMQARDWEHGTFMGSVMSSETTAAAAGKRGVLRADPFAMKPFCGYNMGDYFSHWLSFTERTEESKLPKIFHVNWFRKNNTGKFLWPGFGENIRVLEWIFKRCQEDPIRSPIAEESPVGFLPTPGSINTEGLDVTPQDMEELFHIDKNLWKQDVQRYREFHSQFGDRLPQQIVNQTDLLHEKISN